MNKLTIPAMIFSCVLGANSAFARDCCQPGKHARVPVITDLTYHRARTRLLAAGWQPRPTIHHNDADTNPNTSHGNGKLFWERGYREVENCAGTGLAPCSFLFEDVYGNRLRVTTAGEELTKPRSYARVTSFRFVCEEE